MASSSSAVASTSSGFTAANNRRISSPIELSDNTRTWKNLEAQMRRLAAAPGASEEPSPLQHPPALGILNCCPLNTGRSGHHPLRSAAWSARPRAHHPGTDRSPGYAQIIDNLIALEVARSRPLDLSGDGTEHRDNLDDAMVHLAMTLELIETQDTTPLAPGTRSPTSSTNSRTQRTRTRGERHG